MEVPGAAGVTGVFTDGSAVGNPGPGGWGVIWLKNGRIVDQRSGGAPATTNSRMELQALIEAFRILPPDAARDVVSNSEACFLTITEWGPAWRRAQWRPRNGAIANLDLVKKVLALADAHPHCRTKWAHAHAAGVCNKYADLRPARRARAEPGGRAAGHQSRADWSGTN